MNDTMTQPHPAIPTSKPTITCPAAQETSFSQAVVSLLAASVLSSLGWVFEGEAVKYLSPLSVISVALLLGGTAQLVIAYLLRSIRPLHLTSKELLSFLVFSLIRTACLSLLFAYCLTLTSSSKTMFLTKIEPYIVLLIQIAFYHHRTSAKHLTLLALHLCGAVVLSTGGTLALSSSLIGDAFLFLGVIIHALLYAPAQRFSHRMGSLVASGAGQVIGGVTLLPLALSYAGADFSLSHERHLGWYYTLLTVVVFYILSTALWFHSLKGVPAWLASALRCAGPVIAAPFAWVLFGQTLTPPQVAGACTVIATSIAMVFLERGKVNNTRSL